MPEKIEFPKPKATTPPFHEVWRDFASNVVGFSHYEDDDPNLPSGALKARVIWRKFASMKKRQRRMASALEDLVLAYIEQNDGDGVADDDPVVAANEILADIDREVLP